MQGGDTGKDINNGSNYNKSDNSNKISGSDMRNSRTTVCLGQRKDLDMRRADLTRKRCRNCLTPSSITQKHVHALMLLPCGMLGFWKPAN